MNNPVFAKTMRNIRNNKDIKLITSEERRNYLFSEPNYNKKDFFFITFIKHRNESLFRRYQKQVILESISILEISKAVVYEFVMIVLNQNMEKKQNYVTWIQRAFYSA